MRTHRILLAFLAWAAALGVLVSLAWLGSVAWQQLLDAGQALANRGWARAIRVSPELGIFVPRCLIDTACGEVLLRVWGRSIPQWQLYIPFAPLVVWIVLGITERFGGKFQDPGQGRWAETKDLGSYLKDSPRQPRRIGYMGLVGKGVLRLPENARCAHTLIIGGTGAGKTTRYLNPNLLLDARDGLSAVVFDLKYPDPRSGFLETINFFRAWGRRVYAFTPFDPDSARLPLLDGVKTFQHAFEIAEIFRPTGQQDGAVFYRNNERQLLAGLILGVSIDGQPTMRRVYELLSQGADPLRAYVNERPAVREVLAALLGLKTDVLAGICTGLAGDLQLFLHPYLNRATSAGPGHLLDLRRLCLEPGFLYIGVPQEELQGGKGQVLLRLFKKLLDQAILEVAGEHGGRLPVHLSVYLDEFPSFGPLPNIAENLATMRSRRVAYHIALQNRAQGEAVYGRDEFRAMINNNFAQMVIFPRSLRLEDAQFFSESFGEVTVREESHSVNQEPGLFGIMGRSRQSRSFKEVARRLLTAEAMRTFPDGSAVVELVGTPPVIVRMPRLDERDSPLRQVYRRIQSRFAIPQLRRPDAALPEEPRHAVSAVSAEPPRNPLAETFRVWVGDLLQGGVPLALALDDQGKPLELILQTGDLDGLPVEAAAWADKGWVQTGTHTLTVTRLGLSRVERLWKALCEQQARLPALRWAADHAALLEGHPRAKNSAQSPLGRWTPGSVWLPLDVALDVLEAASVDWQDIELAGRSVSLVEVRWAAQDAVVLETSQVMASA
ncbi:type IV secretory system conjugative DNA transfer family protein [Deinococcus koreensis]|uniref:Type IV secretion system protein VirD4 n=1 Tax=Deinococcus koreensis TaxID=2054903 RepID=A0A2K3USZ3_9DEIO|nr:type IV secretory system conjugative DNA transfer family protein [Deinococcus koreensis]PNY79663.1 type IV secretion system protein VirD4 [Deinococcus koreensis]